MMFQPKLDVYDRYPDTLVIAFTRVGSLIALLKVASILKLYHQRKFERSYLGENTEDQEAPPHYQNSKINESQDSITEDQLLDAPSRTKQSFRDMFTFENIRYLMSTV